MLLVNLTTMAYTRDFNTAELWRKAGDIVQDRNDWTSFAEAEAVAEKLTEATGVEFLATDRPNSYPRFDIVDVPKVGDPVSYAFNGDSYPDGEVASVSETRRVVTTTTGNRYFRRKQTGAWMRGSTWSLIRGHVSTLNPHF